MRGVLVMVWLGRVAIVLALAAGVAAAEELSGQVVDAEGAPVAGAEVWVTGLGPMRGEFIPTGELLGTATSGEDGRFELTWQPVEHVSPYALPSSVGAYKPGMALGMSALSRAEGLVTLRLDAASGTSLTVGDEAGEPLAGVRVGLQYVVTSLDARRETAAFFFAPEQLRERFAWKPDEDGRVPLDLLPKDAMAAVEVITPDRGTIITAVMGGSETRIRIPEAASLSGRVTGPEALDGIKLVMVGHYPEGGTGYPIDEAYAAQIELTTDDEGRFAIETLPAGKYRLSVSPEDGSQWLLPTAVRFAALPGEAVEDVEVALERGWPVTGRCVRAGTGEPVEGVVVMAIGDEGPISNQGKTNAEGRFRFYASVGRLRLNVGAPKQYIERRDIEPVGVVEGTGAMVPDIELQRAATVSGVVVDEQGEPAPGAEVWGWADPEPTHDLHTVANGAGRFEITRLPLGSEITLHASTMNAVTRLAMTVVTAEETEPLELVVVEEAAGFATGRVVDDEGQPQAGVTVTISRRPREGGSPSRRALREVTTDTDGTYQTGALAPGIAWETATGVGMVEERRSEEFVCARGETTQVPDLVVDVADGTLAGVVVDADGQPLAGVEILNVGDGPENITTTTDAEGRFELTGLWDGTAWAFARGPGYRPARAMGETGDSDLTITLLPADARADAPGDPPADDLAARRALAEELAQEVFDQASPGEKQVRGGALAALARANPALAEELWRMEGRPMESTFIEAYALGLSEPDPNAAIDWLMEAAASVRARGLIAVGRAIAEDHPPLAAEAFSLAATSAEAAGDEAGQTKALGQAAEGLLLLGYPGGADVARHAAELVRTSEADHWSRLSSIGVIARALALTDVDEALALVDVIKEIDPQNQYGGQRELALFHVACAVARTDPDRAMEIAETTADYYGNSLGHARLAWEIWEADPAKALEYARGVTRPVRGPLAIGYLAPRQEDQEQAWELIDEAAGPITELAERMGGRWGGSEYAVAAARLALVAEGVNYPDVQRLVTLALMMRAPRSRWVADRRQMWSIGDLPGMLVWSDAEAARVLLEPAVDAPEGFDPERPWDWDKLLRAMATVDPAWAAMKVRELAAEHSDAQPRQRWHWHVELARFLALTREEQIEETITGWLPGKWEDE